MSEWPNWWILRLPETIDRGVETARGCNCHCLCHWVHSVARVRSGFVMIVRESGIGTGVGIYSRPLRGVGVLAMPDAGLDTTWRIESVCEVPPGAGVQQLLVPGVVVWVFIDHHCIADMVEVTRRLISARRELSSEDEGMEFRPWLVEDTEHPPLKETLSPAGKETWPLAGGSCEFPDGPHCWWLWRVSNLRTFHTTGVMWG